MSSDDDPDKKKPKMETHAEFHAVPTADADGFLLPSKRMTRKVAASQRKEKLIETQNGFESLSDSEMSVNETPTLPRKRNREKQNIPNPPNNNIPTKQAQIVDNSPPKPAKPVIVHNTSITALRALFKSLKLAAAPELRKRQENDFAIYASSAADKKIIIEKLNSQEILHYTFTENEDRHLMFTLFGHHKVSTEELLSIINAELEAKKKKVKVTKTTQVNKNLENPIFVVSFEKGAMTLNELKYQHNVLDGLRVRWERHEPKFRRPTQCKRCQRPGHAAHNCSLPYRCVKCLQSHAPGECTRKNRDEGQPSCVNCGVEGHASNSPTCPFLRKHAERINAKKKPSSQPRTFSSVKYTWNSQQQQSPQNFVNDINNFPPIASQSSPSTSHHPNIVQSTREYRPSLYHAQNTSKTQNMPKNDFSQLNQLQNEILTLPDMTETIRLYAIFVEELKLAKNHGERIAVIFKHTGNNAEFAANRE